jgi:hypothetical protein
MINSYISAKNQLDKINHYMKNNTENLFINIDFYNTLMDIRERLQSEINNYEIQQRKLNSRYGKELKRRNLEMDRINRKDKERKAESIFEEELKLWFD